MLGLIVSLLVLANAISAFLQKDAPHLSLTFNPANTEAIVALATTEERRNPGSWSQATKSEVHRGLLLSPADARLHSLAALIAEQSGNTAVSEMHFASALFLLPTEFQALVRALVADIGAERFEQAVDRAELLARRWPDRWSVVAPFIAPTMNRPQWLDLMAQRFASIPERRSMLLSPLLRDNQNLPAAMALVLRWFELGVTDIDREVTRLIATLLRNGNYDVAHDLFLQTRSSLQLKETGYINNSRFNLPTSNNAFDWNFRTQSGMEIRWLKAEGDSKGASAEVRFLGRPMQLNTLSQSLVLVPGMFQLTLQYRSDALSTPKPVEVVVKCRESNAIIARSQLVQGSTERITQRVDFEVPASQCQLAEIRLLTNPVPLSLRFGLSGTVRLFEVSLKKYVER